MIFDVDPEFANSDEWYEAIPEGIRPAKDQPFYHLLAENAESSYVADDTQQNLVPDESGEPSIIPRSSLCSSASTPGGFTPAGAPPLQARPMTRRPRDADSAPRKLHRPARKGSGR